MLFYKNRELSKKLFINLSKWKRWVREFLPPDPLGGLQSGYARQLNLKETFKVYLGGYLVSNLKFSLPEARIIISDLAPWLRKHGFYSLHLDQLAAATNSSLQHIIFIYNNPNNGFAYTIRDIICRKNVEHGSGRLEKFVQIVLNHDDDLLITGSVEGARVLSITNLVRGFIKRMES